MTHQPRINLGDGIAPVSLFVTEVVLVGFSASQPAGAWTSLGQMSIEECVSACYQSNDLFMMVRTVDGVTSCWSAPIVDMSLLSQQFPSGPGEYEVFDISPMKIGSQSAVSHSSGFVVKSTIVKNGYRTFTVTMPGKIYIAFQKMS